MDKNLAEIDREVDTDRMSHRKQSESRLFPWHVFLPFIVFMLHSLLFRAWLVDDAGISFAYARNFIHGHGLVSQPGVGPVEGFSNPLWTFLISPLFLSNPTDPTLLVKLMSFGLVLGTFASIAGINRVLFGQSWWSRSTTAVVLLFVALNTSFVVWTTSGLENPLYAFFCALYCLFSLGCATAVDRRSATLAVYAGLSAAAMALTRPEGLVFLAAFPGMLAIRVVNDVSDWKAQVRRLAIFLVAVFLPIIAYILFRAAYFGDVYPNTYHAKGGPLLQDVVGVLLLTKPFIDKTYDLFHGMFSERAGLVLVLFLFGVAHLVLVRRKTSAVVFLLPILVCSWAVYCLLPYDWMGEYRFGTPFFVSLPLVGFALLTDTLVTSSLSSRTREVVFLTIVALFLAHWVQVYLPRSIQFAKGPTVPFAGVAQRFGKGFNAYANELDIPEASFLAPDLGGTLYFSKLRVYDLAGLCDRTIAPLINADDTTKFRDYIFDDLRPTFIHVHDSWSLRSGFYSDDRFRELYATIQETASEWAEKRGYSGIYSGDYVLRDAIHSQEDFERLRHKVQGNTQ